MRSKIIAIALLTSCSSTPTITAEPETVAVEVAAASPEPEPLPLVEVVVPEAVESDAPPGFPAIDEFADLRSACMGLVPRLVDREDLREPILDWCFARAYASSRNGVVRSRIDGSWIHDRDRPVAKSFYDGGLRSGDIDPETCEHHVVDTSIKRTRAAAAIVERWPYGTYCDPSTTCRPSSPGVMRASVADRWLKRAPDYERFGTRGPMDNNFATAVRYLGGCFSPEQLDRFDVAAAVVIERSEALCEQLEQRLNTRARRESARAARVPISCRFASDIREIWHPSFWYRDLRRVIPR